MATSRVPALRLPIHVTRRPSRRLVVVAAVAVVLAIMTAGPAAPPPTGPADDKALDTWLDARLADAGYPGASVALLRGDGTVHLTVRGDADASGRPVTAATPFVIGSLAKSLTAMGILRLADDGRVALDAPATAYLPELRSADGPASNVTIRDLLDQTSGLPAQAIAIGAPPEPSTGPATPTTALAALARVHLAAVPGTQYAYSNANYVVLGATIEAVTGEPYATAMDDLVFGPLGMTHTTADHATAVAMGLGDAHRLWFGLASARPALWRSDLAPAGFIASTPTDLLRPIGMILAGGTMNGQPFLTPASIRALTTGTVPTGVGGGRYAMGWVDGDRDGVRTIAHAGSTTDMAAFQAIDPGSRDAIVVLADAQSAPFELLGKIDGIGYGALDLMAGRAPGGTLDAFYPTIDLVLLVLLVRWSWSLVRLGRETWRHETPSRSARGRVRRSLGFAFRAYLDVLVPVVILVRMPDLLGAGWPDLVRTDVGLVLAVVVALRLVDGGLRTAGWWRERSMASGVIASAPGTAAAPTASVAG